jgi:hypothetical protein
LSRYKKPPHYTTGYSSTIKHDNHLSPLLSSPTEAKGMRCKPEIAKSANAKKEQPEKTGKYPIIPLNSVP